jgi:hypothetical protein
MKRSAKDRLFAVKVEFLRGRQPEVLLVHAQDEEAAKRRGAWYARVKPEQVLEVVAAA